jgi:hypothetical protein
MQQEQVVTGGFEQALAFFVCRVAQRFDTLDPEGLDYGAH